MAACSSVAATATSNWIENAQYLTDFKEIEKAYERLSKEEDDVTVELTGLTEQQATLESKMASLNKLLPNLKLIYGDSQNLSGMISFTSTLAENVSSKVRQLDLAKSRVMSVMQRVEDVLDLKFCTDGVQTALQNEDYEQAAAHIHRFLSLDENVLRMAEDVSEGGQLETSFKLLHVAESKLKTIVHRQFDAAVHAGDVASVERFFKIFPLLGLHDDGLAKFSRYLSAQIADTADKNLKLSQSGDKPTNKYLYADTMTILFENIAKVVETHQPLVETYYGPGHMFNMLQHIQKECDRQTRKIIEQFKEKREFEKKTQQVQQSLMNQSKPPLVDPKNLDGLLAEITLLNTRSELYLRFVRRRSTADLEVAATDQKVKDERFAEVDKFLNNCELSRVMQELIGFYIMMEQYFMKEMVEKAVNMDMMEEASLTSSMVDDAFFIIKKCVRRAMSSSSVDGVCAMLNHACTTLEQDFREVLYARLRNGFPLGFDISQAYNLVQSSIQQGKLQSSDIEKDKQIFLVTLNDTEVSCEYIQTLKKNLELNVAKLYKNDNEQSKAKLKSCLSDLGAVSNQFKSVLEFGFSQLSSSAVKPQVKPWVNTFQSTSHNISEEDFANYEANDPWVQNFIVNLDTLLSTFKGSMTTSNYDGLVNLLSNEITNRLEKAVMKTHFNRLGGLQFDKELRSLVGYLTSVTTWTIRDKFARLTQMATILNLERVTEILDYWGQNSGPLTWRLTPAEVRQVLSLRSDFRNEDIRRLKL
ncbi:conserved oligomeric Golgi complex subunit 4-like [Tubulanus polymorphus]|uniref:conserved oligomeric Golgi complex subunit 4-like n=1 Tax=Tubulanus polymorphus TaxID=672921 RepID=UPI003DA247B7